MRLTAVITFALMIAFAGWCLFALRGDLAQLSFTALQHSWNLVLLATFMSLLNYVFRIWRWRSYLARLGHHLPIGFAALTFTAGFAYTLSPGKVGEMVRARYYVPLGIPLRDVTAAFFAERLMDLVAMIVLAALLLTATARYQGATVAAAAGVALVLVLLAWLPWGRIADNVQSATRLPRLARTALLSITSAVASTRPLLRPGVLLFGFIVGLLAWGLEGAGLGVLTSIYSDVHVKLLTAVGIYAVAVLIGGLSFLPGGLGGTEAVMTALLVTQGYSVPQALSITLTCRLVTLWLAVLLGWLAVAGLRRKTLRVVVPWQ
jgi:uncharacterized protein (TIRG00374 family)